MIERAVIIAGEGPLTISCHLPQFHARAGPRPATDIKEPDAVRLPVGTPYPRPKSPDPHHATAHRKTTKRVPPKSLASA